jgi:hypothetical protein
MVKMGDISKNLSLSEVKCKCGCGLYIIIDDTVNMFQKIRDALGRPLIVNSFCRCQWNNAKCGGVVAVRHYLSGTKKLDLSKYPRGVKGEPTDSNHTHGTAIDIACPGVAPEAVRKVIRDLWSAGKLPELAGLGAYKTFTHVDVTPKVAGRLRTWTG